MITEAIVGALVSVVLVPLTALPVVGASALPLPSSSGLVLFGMLDAGLPVHEMVALLGVWLTVAGAVFAWRLARTLLGLLPTMGG